MTPPSRVVRPGLPASDPRSDAAGARPGAPLIDQRMVPAEVSIAGAGERYRRGETPHTIHVWWARRPHAAMRALLFACLCRDGSDRSLAMMQRLAATPPDADALAAARAHIAQHGARPDRGGCPRVLDMFGGGGTIPFEAANLGAEAHSLDLSELAVFLQRSLLVHARAVPPARLLDGLHESGQRVLARLARDSAPLFPRRGQSMTYFWSYSLACGQCGYRLSLMRRPWLSRRGRRRIGLRIETGDRADRVIVDTALDPDEPARRWSDRKRTAGCPRCGFVHEHITMAGCRDELVAVAHPGEPARWYAAPAARDVPPDGLVRALEAEVLDALGSALPASELPCWSGVVNPPLHGLQRHAELPNPRQRAVLLLLIRALRDEHLRLRDDHGPDLARAVISLLSGLVDQLVDWNCRLSMWISQNEQVGRAFCGPGIAMLWDYAETDPVGAGPSNLHAKLARIVAGARGLVDLPGPCHVHRGRAQALPFPAEHFDAVVTDPPYYDNLVYSALADCFFAWKRLLLHELEPALFAAPCTDAAHELVASARRHGSPARAHAAYCSALHEALCEAERVLVRDGVLALVYSHASVHGWQALVHAYRHTGLEITSVQPLRIERRQRPRAMRARAVNTCVVLVARRLEAAKVERTLDEIAAALGERCTALREVLAAAGWPEADMALAAFAQGVALLANARRVHGARDDLHALRRMADAVRAAFPGFALAERPSL